MPRREPGEPYARVDSNEASGMLAADPDGTVVIDVRRDDEWVTGHVTGAIHINVDELTDRIADVPQDKKLLFICAAGVRSALACEMAAAMGRSPEQLFNLEEGMIGWVESNFPTSQDNDS